MALMPKRVKHRKSQRGRIKGEATRGNRVVFGDFGLQAVQGGWISAATIEAGRIAAQQYLRTEGRLYIRIFPHKSVSSIPLETRMGKGKGEPDFWAAVVKPGIRRSTSSMRFRFSACSLGSGMVDSPGIWSWLHFLKKQHLGLRMGKDAAQPQVLPFWPLRVVDRTCAGDFRVEVV